MMQSMNAQISHIRQQYKVPTFFYLQAKDYASTININHTHKILFTMIYCALPRLYIFYRDSLSHSCIYSKCTQRGGVIARMPESIATVRQPQARNRRLPKQPNELDTSGLQS